jgi:sensor domain CHASE-containing protein
MRQAAKRLGVSPNKISRLAEKNRIKTRDNPLDERVRLVDFNELEALFASAPVVVKDDKDDAKDTVR